MDYINTYLRAQTADDINNLRGSFRNVSGPVQGRAATEQTMDDDGNTIPAQEAVGDPDYFYALVTHVFAIPAFGPYELVDPVIGKLLCGEG